MVAPTLDGFTGGIKSGTGPGTTSLTTTKPNDIIVVAIYAEVTGSGAPAVATVTAPGLTFARRVRSNGSTKGSVELWWALSTEILTALPISITWAAAFDNASFVAFGVNGCNTTSPWDGNASIPAVQSNNGTWTPSFSGLSTSRANDFLIFGCGTPTPSSGQPGAPSGFSTIASRTNGGGSLFSTLVVFSREVTSPLSSATISGSTTANGTNAGEAFFDALTADAQVATVTRRPQVFVCT